MAVDVSTLSIKVATSGIDDSIAKLDKLSTSADKAEVATKKFSTSSSSSYQAVTKELQNLQRVANTTSIVPASSGTAAAVAGIKMVTNAIAGVGTQSKKSADESKNAFQAIGGSIAQLRTLLGGGLIMGGLVGMSSSIIAMADSWKMMQARLEIFTKSAESAKKVQKDLVQVAMEIRAPLEGIVQLYTRAAPALQRFGYNSKDAMEVTKGVAAALKLSGATGAEASSVMLQFSQSLQAGRLNGAEFNAVAEGAPILLQAIIDHLHKTNGGIKITMAQLKAMGAAGTLDISLMVDSIKKKLPELEEKLKSMPITFDAAMTNLRTAFTQVVGDMEQNSGVVKLLANGLVGIANNAKLVANAIVALATGAMTYFIAVGTKKLYFMAAEEIATRKTIANNLVLAKSEYAAALATQEKVLAVSLMGARAPAAIAATEALAVANTNLAAATTAAAGGAGILSRFIGFMGGPIGIITTLLTIGAMAWMTWGDSAAESAEKATDRIEKTRRGLVIFNEEQNKTDKISSEARLKQVKVEIEANQKKMDELYGGLAAQKNQSYLGNGQVGQVRGGEVSTVLIEKQNALLKEQEGLVKAVSDAKEMQTTFEQNSRDKAIQDENERLRRAGKAQLDKGDKQLAWQDKMDKLLIDRGKAVAGMVPDSPAYNKETERTQKQIADLEKLNPQLIEEAKNRAQAAKEARAQAAAQAKKAAATNADTEAKSAYSNALQSVKEFQDGLNQAETTHKSLLIDINNKTRQAVDDINQKTAAIEAERKGTILTASTKIAMDAKEKQAAAEAIDLKIREQEILRENSSMTLLEARRNYDAQVTRIEQIGTATDAESKQARAAAVNRLQFYAGEIKKQTAIEQTIGKLTASAEAQEKIKEALDDQAFSQAMLDMEKVGRSLGETLSNGFGEAAKSLGNLINVFEAYSKQQAKIESDNAVAKEKAKGDTVKLAQVEKAYVKAKVMSETKAYADIAGAAKGFFKQHTTGYKVMDATERAFRAMEMAMAAKSTIEKLGGIAKEMDAQGPLNYLKAQSVVLSQGSGDPYTAFARMAAMAAFVASIGMSIGGGGGKDTTAQDRQEAAGTGSILGDLTAKSESIDKSISLLEQNSSLSVEYNAGMLASLRNIEASMTGVASLAIKGGVNTTDFKGGIGSAASSTKNFLSNILVSSVVMGPIAAIAGSLLNKPLTKLISSVFGGKTSLQDVGITAKSESLGSVLSSGLNASKYTDIKKSGGWFRSDKTSRSLTPLSNEMNQQFGMVITGLYSSVMQAGKVLGMESGLGAKLKAFVVDIGDISLKDLSAEDIEKQFSNIFSKIGDDMAKFGFGDEFLAKYAKIGEGPFETLMRVASAIATVDGLFLNLGIDVSNAFDSISMSGVDAKMQLIEFAGGLDKLSSSLGAYYDKYYTDAEKQKIAADQVGAKLASMGLNILSSSNVDETKRQAENLANFRKLVEQQDLGTESGRRAYAALLEIAPTYADLAEKLGAGELLGVGQTIPQAQMDAANAWWEAKGGPAAVDTQQVIADGITTLNDLGAKDKTIAAMATQSAADTAATIQTLREMVAAQQTTNNILMAKIDSLTAAVADAGKKTVDAVVDTANTVTR